MAVRQQPFTEIEEPVSISSNTLLAEKVNVDPEPLGEIDSTMPTSSIIPVNNLPFQFRKRAFLVLMYTINIGYASFFLSGEWYQKMLRDIAY